MKTSKRGIDLIKMFESFSPKVYICPAGIPTIGYGTTRYPDGRKVSMGDPNISEIVATNYLMYDVKIFENFVDVYVMTDVNQNQFDALVSFVYNIGPMNFKSSTLLKLINQNPNHPGIFNQFQRWNKAKGKILPSLVKRRIAEGELYISKN